MKRLLLLLLLGCSASAFADDFSADITSETVLAFMNEYRAVAGQMPLRIAKPRRVQPLRLAVGDARRHVAVAHEDRALSQLALHEWPRLVAICDVQELHDVGAPIASAGESLANLDANWRLIRRKRQQPHLASCFNQPVT
jgi:hypothetical protein